VVDRLRSLSNPATVEREALRPQQQSSSSFHSAQSTSFSSPAADSPRTISAVGLNTLKWRRWSFSNQNATRVSSGGQPGRLADQLGHHDGSILRQAELPARPALHALHRFRVTRFGLEGADPERSRLHWQLSLFVSEAKLSPGRILTRAEFAVLISSVDTVDGQTLTCRAATAIHTQEPRLQTGNFIGSDFSPFWPLPAWHRNPAQAQSVESFYKGKTIHDDHRWFAGRRLRHAGARHRPAYWPHIPGGPAVRRRNMPGAGGTQALDHLYNGADKGRHRDGAGEPTRRRSSAVQRTPMRFRRHQVQLARNPQCGKPAGADLEFGAGHSVADLKSKEITVGASGGNSAHAFYSRLINCDPRRAG